MKHSTVSERTFSKGEIERAFGLAPVSEDQLRSIIESMLMDAARNGCLQQFQRAHYLGVLEQTTKFYANLTYLMTAVQNRQVNVVRFLLENGVDPNIADDYGHTALDFAREDNNQALIELLEESTIQ